MGRDRSGGTGRGHRAPAAACFPMPRLACFTGPKGSRDQACDAEHVALRSEVTTRGHLGAGEGLTLVVGMPKRFIIDGAAATGVRLPRQGGTHDPTPRCI